MKIMITYTVTLYDIMSLATKLYCNVLYIYKVASYNKTSIFQRHFSS